MRSATILILFAALLHHKGASNAQLANIWQIVNTDARLKVLAMALQAAGLEEVFQQPGSITLFAPTDAAFAKVPPETIERLTDPQNKDELAALLAYHAIGDKVITSADILKLALPASLDTLAGKSITVTTQGNQVKINDATVVAADILACNGIIHFIDGVLVPPS